MANIISSTARTVSQRSFATLALAMMIVLMTNGSFAGVIQLDNGYSPGELSKECKANHGTFKAGGNAYECIGKGGTVVCTGDGSKAGATCTGSCPKCGTSAAKTIGISGILHPSRDTPTKVAYATTSLKCGDTTYTVSTGTNTGTCGPTSGSGGQGVNCTDRGGKLVSAASCTAGCGTSNGSGTCLIK